MNDFSQNFYPISIENENRGPPENHQCALTPTKRSLMESCYTDEVYRCRQACGKIRFAHV